MNSVIAYVPRRRRIGLTALIDVVFIMLMFFMLTSSFEQWKTIQIDSPVSEVQTSTPTLPQFIVLTTEGLVYPLHKADQSVSFLELSTNVWGDLESTRPVLLLPAPEVKLQLMISVIEKLREIGLSEVSLGDPYQEDSAEGNK
ncbi:hypothetical protein JCM30760_02290 [Thiomicrorhabdus hydrogeniphila]